MTSFINLAFSIFLTTLASAIFAADTSEYVIRSHVGAGFFAELNKVISFIKGNEFHLKKINVDWSQEFFPYKDKPQDNGWDLFFEPIILNSNNTSLVPLKTEHTMHDQLCIDHWISYEENLPYRLNINRILNKYIQIKPEILKKFDEYYKKNLAGFYSIGVHVRWGSAHVAESPKGTPTLEDYISEVNDMICKIKTDLPFKIYLATDSQEVIEKFEENFSSELLFYLPAVRSPNREESHLIYDNTPYWLTHPEEFHAKKPGYIGGVFVLLDCLLLARCNVFIHSTSNVSEFVAFFSPYIQSVYLPKNNITWPCRYGLRY